MPAGENDHVVRKTGVQRLVEPVAHVNLFVVVDTHDAGIAGEPPGRMDRPAPKSRQVIAVVAPPQSSDGYGHIDLESRVDDHGLLDVEMPRQPGPAGRV